MPQRKLISLQTARGIAVCLVLLYHMHSYESRFSTDQVLGNIFLIGASGVDLFFVISGFVMVTITAKNSQESAHGPGSFLLRRAARIYPLYWFYTIIAVSIFTIIPSLANRGEGVNDISLWKSLLLFPDVSAPYVGQGWTLVHEMYFYLVFSLALAVSFSVRSFLIAWSIPVIFVSYFINTSWIENHEHVGPVYKIISSPLTLEFIAGGLIVPFSFKCNKITGITSILAGLLLLLFFHLWDVAAPHREISFGIPSILVVFGFVATEHTTEWGGPRFMAAIGDASYSIYLSHIFCLSAIAFVWKRYGGEGVFDNLVFLTLMAIFSILAGFVSYHFIEKPLIYLSKKLLA